MGKGPVGRHRGEPASSPPDEPAGLRPEAAPSYDNVQQRQAKELIVDRFIDDAFFVPAREMCDDSFRRFLHDLHLGLSQEPLEVAQRAVVRMDVEVIGDAIAVVVAVVERLDVQFVDDGVLVPEGVVIRRGRRRGEAELRVSGGIHGRGRSVGPARPAGAAGLRLALPGGSTYICAKH